METKIKIYGHKRISAKGNEYCRFTAKFDGKWYDVVFTNKCSVLRPVDDGEYELTVEGNLSTSAGKPYIGKDGSEKMGNGVIWIDDYKRLSKI